MKNLFKSKTLWFNVANAILMYGDFIPQKIQGPVVPGGNILLRFLTNQPLNIPGLDGKK